MLRKRYLAVDVDSDALGGWRAHVVGSAISRRQNPSTTPETGRFERFPGPFFGAGAVAISIESERVIARKSA